MKIAFYGSSLLSSYWNGAATYYRGLIKALAELGHAVTFYEPDALGRQERRDLDPPPWCDVVVYPASLDGLREAAAAARTADVVIKTSGVGFHDDELLNAVMQAADPAALRIWWDVDAPATLAAIGADATALLRQYLPLLDAVFTYGGGTTVTDEYVQLGAPTSAAVYNAADVSTHFPVQPEPRFAADLAFLGNRLPDREQRVESFFFMPARCMLRLRFLLGGAGWEAGQVPCNVRVMGHVPTADHNAFNSTPCAVLNINRSSMAERGFSPPTRIFEAAAAAACIITDDWPGIAHFLEPDTEILVARDGHDVLRHLEDLTPERARAIGEAARQRVMHEHTYTQRARQVDDLLRDLMSRRHQGFAA